MARWLGTDDEVTPPLAAAASSHNHRRRITADFSPPPPTQMHDPPLTPLPFHCLSLTFPLPFHCLSLTFHCLFTARSWPSFISPSCVTTQAVQFLMVLSDDERAELGRWGESAAAPFPLCR